MSNAHLFRTQSRMEETMMRATMPRTHAADPIPERKPTQTPRATWSLGRRYEQKVNFTLAEVLHVS